ncbi:16S rRNA (uracil(1498)-N(3))-methyltransferase [Kordiimonas sediminis]|nr:16S rRNA (uracil(1498)-N(3))-methyltransferase [Kordiimonas sediminis]
MKNTRSYKYTRLYLTVPLSQGTVIELDKEQSHYLANVMRQKLGASLLVFNGKDGEWLAEISDLQKRSVSLKVKSQTKPQTPEPDLWLAFAPIKKARLDFIAQKATELGVSHLIPTMTNRTIVDRVKSERLDANAAEASEQSERLTVPTIADPIKLSKLLDDWPEDRMIMFCDEDLSGKPAIIALQETLPDHAGKPWALLIGPEGGFDDNERDRIQKHPNTVTVSLGPRVLRADTAALAAISLWQAVLGDWS